MFRKNAFAAPARRVRGFSIVELMICALVVLAVTSGLYVAASVSSSAYVAARDMDRLARWLNNALSRADAWKCDFTLSVYMPADRAENHFMILRWAHNNAAKETFEATSGVRWTLTSGKVDFTYQWHSHSVSPAFTVQAWNGSEFSGETLTVSLRGYVTRAGGE